VAYILAALVAAGSSISGVMNSFGWANVVLDAAFTLGFGYLLFIRKAA
jgi:hypothetical protein